MKGWLKGILESWKAVKEDEGVQTPFKIGSTIYIE